MDLQALDFIVLAVVVVSVLLSLMRGFTREALSLAGWALAVYGAIFFAPELAPLFAGIGVAWVADALAMLVVFVAVLFTASLLAKRLSSALHKSSIGALDRTLGVIFGGLRGLFIACAVYFAVSLAVPEDAQPNWMAEAKSRPLLQTGARLIAALAPADRLQSFGLPASGGAERLLRRELERQGVEIPEINSQDNGQSGGYKQLDRDQIENLIRNMQKVQ